MFIQTEYFPWTILAISSVAVVTDLLRGKIYNWLTLPCILLGLGLSLFYGSWSGLGLALAATALGLLLYGWMFFTGAMGAGDVKLLMALGALGGIQYVVNVAILGVLVGGVLAVISLASKGRLRQFVQKMTVFFATLMARELKVQFPNVDKKLTMPFGVSLGIAAVWVSFANPLVKWGILNWNF